MRILCVIQRYHPVIGGSEILTKKFMDFLSKKHEITVYTTIANDIRSFWNRKASKIGLYASSGNYEIKRYDFLTPTEIKFEHDEIFSLSYNHPGPFSPKMWQDLVLEKINYNLILAVGFPYDHIIPAYVAAKKWKIPIVIIPLIHQEFPELYLTSMRLTMLNDSDGVFVLSESEKKKLVYSGIDKRKISLILPPVDITEWNDLDSDKFRKSISTSKEKKIILFAGSKALVKGAIFLIESLKMVWKKKYDPLLVMLGPTTKEFEEYFSKLSPQIKEKIVDLGIVTEETRKNAFAACDVLAVPSKSESFGLVYLDAWICHKPVIGCNIDSTSEVISDKKDGILVEFGNVEQLSDVIIYLINNPSICEKYGEEGRKKLLFFSSKHSLADFEDKCISIIKDSKSKADE